MSNSGMSLRSKLMAMSVSTLAALLILFIVLLFNSKQQMMADREDKVRNLVEAAQSTLAVYESQEKSGGLTREQAQNAAKAAIRAMRYDKTEYFWIHDMHDSMVMHPIKPELEGKKLDQLKDKNGKLFFNEMNQVVRSKNAGFVEYFWPKPGTGSDVGVPKISYVSGFLPWGWVIGSGIYVDDVDAKFRSDALNLLLWGIGIGGFVVISLAMLSRNIIRTLGGDHFSGLGHHQTDCLRRPGHPHRL